MKKILIVEDSIFKREQITDFLDEKGIEYDFVEYLNPALIYIFGSQNDISGIILDLGLQYFKDSSPESYNLLRGMDVVRELKRKKMDIPVLINSSTKVPRIEYYPSIYGQRTKIDDYTILEEFVTFLKQREEQ